MVEMRPLKSPVASSTLVIPSNKNNMKKILAKMGKRYGFMLEEHNWGPPFQDNEEIELCFCRKDHFIDVIIDKATGEMKSRWGIGRHYTTEADDDNVRLDMIEKLFLKSKIKEIITKINQNIMR